MKPWSILVKKPIESFTEFISVFVSAQMSLNVVQFRCKALWSFVVLLVLLVNFFGLQSAAEDVFSCGGFVKSEVPLAYNKILVSLVFWSVCNFFLAPGLSFSSLINCLLLNQAYCPLKSINTSIFKNSSFA